jgi:hypothetical protein
MKFMLTFGWAPDAQIRAQAIARFQKSGGLPPPGVNLIGRWTNADLSGGFDVLETDDPQKLAEFAYMWSDLMNLKITPVLDDTQFNAALSSLLK